MRLRFKFFCCLINFDCWFGPSKLLSVIFLFFFFFLVNRSCSNQPHDISNPNYMGVSFRGGNVIDKGWSYSMPPRNVPCGGQAGKEPKKGYDVSTRSPTGKPASV